MVTVDGIVVRRFHHQDLEGADTILITPNSQVSSGFIHIAGQYSGEFLKVDDASSRFVAH